MKTQSEDLPCHLLFLKGLLQGLRCRNLVGMGRVILATRRTALERWLHLPANCSGHDRRMQRPQTSAAKCNPPFRTSAKRCDTFHVGQARNFSHCLPYLAYNIMALKPNSVLQFRPMPAPLCVKHCHVQGIVISKPRPLKKHAAPWLCGRGASSSIKTILKGSARAC